MRLSLDITNSNLRRSDLSAAHNGRNDPPLHTRVRRVILGALSPWAIARMEADSPTNCRDPEDSASKRLASVALSLPLTRLDRSS
ncbi:MAG: hypothetical protein E6J90_38090 [Deltaproteobacteria bacterium]|nr:MAG: hypothetical protein E6J90_38090 [Deltaproteobacteria bacterium]